MEALEFKVEKETAGIRIDRFLADKCGDVSRSYLQKLLKEQQITVNQKVVKANHKVQEGKVSGFSFLK